jgi:RHS repeat-associated protein
MLSLFSFRKKSHRSQKSSTRQSSLKKLTSKHLAMEPLEKRELLAVSTWDGGGTSNLWGDRFNWSDDQVPLANADLVFSGTTRTATQNDLSTTFHSLTFSSSNFSISGSPLSLNNAQPSITVGAGVYYTSIATEINWDNTLTVDANSNSLTLSGNLSSSGGLTKGGNGILTLSGANTYTGTTTVSAGSLTLGASNVLWDTSSLLVNGGTLAMGTYSDTVASVHLQSGYITGSSSTPGTLTSSSSFDMESGTVSVKLGGSVGLTKSTSGILSLQRENTYTGVTTVNGGTLQLGNGAVGNNGSVNGDIVLANSSTLTFYPSSAQTFSHVISGNGNFVKSGTSTLILSCANSYQGNTTLNGGTLQLGADVDTLPVGTSVYCGNNATLDINCHQQTINSLISNGYSGYSILESQAVGPLAVVPGGYVKLGSGGGILSVGSGNFSGVISDNGNLRKISDGTLTIVGRNTFLGTTTIEAGTLRYGTSDRLYTTSGITITGGTLDLGGYGQTTSGAISIQGGTIKSGTITKNTGFYDARGGTVLAILSGTAGLTKTESSLLVLSGNNLYSGGTTVSDGTLQIGGPRSLPGNVNLASTTSVLAFDSNYSQTYSGVISGSGALIKAGSGTLILSGANTFTGPTTISAGTLYLGLNALQYSNLNYSNGTLSFGGTFATLGGLAGSQNLTLPAGFALTVGNNNSSTAYSGALSGSGSLIKTGSGTLTLSGANFYTGGTTIQGGILQLGSGNAIPSGSAVQLGNPNASSGVLDLNGFNLTLSGLKTGNEGPRHSAFWDEVINTNATNAATLTLAINGTDNYLYSGFFAGNLSVIKSGSGMLTVGGVSTNSGTVAVDGGTLQVSGCFVSPITVNSGTLLGNVSLHNYSSISGMTLAANSNSLSGNLSSSSGVIQATDWRAAAYQAIAGTVTVNTNPPLTFPTAGNGNLGPMTAISTQHFLVGTADELRRALNAYYGSDVFSLETTYNVSGDTRLVVFEDGTNHDFSDAYWVSSIRAIPIVVAPPSNSNVTGNTAVTLSAPNVNAATGASVLSFNDFAGNNGCSCSAGVGNRAYDSQNMNWDSGFGAGWSSTEMPQMICDADSGIWYLYAPGVPCEPIAKFGSGPGSGGEYYDSLNGHQYIHDDNSQLTLTLPDGTNKFFDRNSGDYLGTVNPGGSSIKVVWDQGKKCLAKSTANLFANSNAPLYEKETYTYGTDGHVGSVLKEHGEGGSGLSNVSRVTYTYYSYNDQYGLSGDLETATTQQYVNGEWTTGDTTYYRYYTANTYDTSGKLIGSPHELKRVLLPQTYSQVVGTNDPDSIADSTITTCYYYEYDVQHRVTKETVFGNSSTYVLSIVDNNPNANPNHADYVNEWTRKTVEQEPDGSTTTIYTNYLGEPLLTDKAQGPQHWYTYAQYENASYLPSFSKIRFYAEPSAVIGYDPLDASGNWDQSSATKGIHFANSGLVHETDYKSDTGYVEYQKLKEGWNGSSTTLSYYSYTPYYKTVSSPPIYTYASVMNYQDSNGWVTNQTSYNYTFYPDSAQPKVVTTTLPYVSEDEHGSYAWAVRTQWYDPQGNLILAKNEDGRFTYYGYNRDSNQIVLDKQIIRTISDLGQNCDTALLGTLHLLEDFDNSDLPEVGLNQITDSTYDSAGRLTQTLGPIFQNDQGNWVRTASWIVLGDHEKFTAQGYAVYASETATAPSSYVLANPISLTKVNHDNKTTDEIQVKWDNDSTHAGTLAEYVTSMTDSDTNITTIPQSDYIAWTAYNYKKTRLYQTAVYYHIPDCTSDRNGTNFQGTASAGIDDSNCDYNVTTYGYQDFGQPNVLYGRQNKIKTPGGTITRYVFDSRGNVLSTWIGTNDYNASDSDPSGGTAGQAGDNNMVRVTEYQFDVNGNCIQATQHVASGDDRVTKYSYDWRNRLVYTVNPPADNTVHSTYSVNYYDNLDRVIMQQTYYDADTVADLITPNGSINAETANISDYLSGYGLGSIIYGDDELLSCTVTSYDACGQVYRVQSYGINPTPGVNLGHLTGNSVASNTWYDLAGNVIKQQDANSQTFTKTAYDGLGRPTYSYIAYDSTGEITSDLYDVDGNVTLNLLDDGIFQQTEYTYDGAENLIFVTTRQNDDHSLTDKLDFSNSRSTYVGYWYDGRRRLTNVADFGTHGDPAVEMLPSDRIAMTTPPARGSNFVQVTSTAYNIQGMSYLRTDPAGHKTYTEYDAAGRTTKTIQNYVGNNTHTGTDGNYDSTDSDQNINTKFVYTADSQVSTQTDTLNNTTTYIYGTTISANNSIARNDLLYEEIDPSPDGSVSSPTTYYYYDQLGEVTSVQDKLNQYTTYQYDKLGRQIEVDSPSTATGQPKSYTKYNERGLVAGTTDALNHAATPQRWTAYVYDELNRLQTETDLDGNSTGYTYDDYGRQETLTDPVGNTTTWGYDELNRVTSELDNQNGQYRTYTYVGGLVNHFTDRNGRTTDYFYDQFGREKEEKWYPSGGGAAQNDLHFGYDILGHLTSASDNFASYTYTPDALGHNTEVDQTITGYLPMVMYSQIFDGNGNRTELSAAIGGTADFTNDYQYDNLGRMKQVKQYGATSGTVADKLVNFTYNADGQFYQLKRYADVTGSESNRVATGTYGYDADGRLTDLTYDFQLGSVPAPAYTWTWDAGNRITQFTSSTDRTNGSNDPASVTYHYDNMGQLANNGTTPAAQYTNWSSSISDENYTYDENGNRQYTSQPNDGVGADNQLAADGTYKYLYDPEGNRIARYIGSAPTNGQMPSTASNITKYTWDNRNRLVKVEKFASASDYADGTNSMESIVYAYDFQNRLIHKTLDPDGSHLSAGTIQQTVYVYDGNQIVLQFEKSGTGSLAAGNLTHRDLWGPAVDQLLAQENVHYNDAEEKFVTDDLLWALTDNLNTVRDLVSYDSGITSLESHRVFDAFGVKKSETPAVDCVFGYTGKLFDDKTGLQNNLNRWYEPTTGKWISKDPIGFDGGDENLYRYCRNETTISIDPMGLAQGPQIPPGHHWPHNDPIFPWPTIPTPPITPTPPVTPNPPITPTPPITPAPQPSKGPTTGPDGSSVDDIYACDLALEYETACATALVVALRTGNPGAIAAAALAWDNACRQTDLICGKITFLDWFWYHIPEGKCMEGLTPEHPGPLGGMGGHRW